MALNQAEDLVCDTADRGHHARPEIGPEHRVDFVRVVLQARDHLPAGTTRGTPSDRVRVKEPDPGTAKSQRQSRSAAGEPCTDHDHIGLNRALKCCGLDLRRRGMRPK